jgi:tetratricopeptide (TPR) repeat protein
MPWNYDLQQRKHKEMLYRALNLGTTVAFLGSGCSRNFDLPDWEGFASEAVLISWDTLEMLKTLPEFQIENNHIQHYQDKVIEFGRQLAIGKIDAADQRIFRLPGGAGVKPERLESLQASIESSNEKYTLPELSESLSGDQLRFILGACRQICDWCHSKAEPATERFLEFLKVRFGTELTEQQLSNKDAVHRKLLNLPIHRFITSNYDLVLEQFLVHKLGQGLEGEHFEKFLKEKAFTQADRDSEKLARFAAGISENSRGMVFHCHGWYRNADSMIVTEENYQKWYLGDADGAGPAFRQTMELLVGSHPILFVGFGMNDPDLLMALRTLSATEPERKPQRSLFALLPEREAKDGNAMEHYLDQYGVHVIGYEAKKNENLGIALSSCLGQLNEDWKMGRDSWLLKPKIHGVEIRKDADPGYWHYKLATSTSDNMPQTGNTTLRKLAISKLPDKSEGSTALLKIAPTQIELSLDRLVNDLKKKRPKRGRLIVLVGDGGTGKSWFATHMLNKLLCTTSTSVKEGFFWSSYYADDALTGIIRANEFFQEGQQAKERKSRLERFLDCLREPKNILVFDGLERFLNPTGQPGIGVAANSGVSNFLEILTKLHTGKGKYRATVVLTTRLVPELLTARGLAEFFSVEPMTAEEAQEHWGSKDFPWAGLVTLLGGHRYAMDLAAQWPQEKVNNLIHYLGNVGLTRRVERMIELAICRIEQAPASQNHDLEYDHSNGKGAYQLLMKRLAVFMGPIKENTTFKYCHELAKKEWCGKGGPPSNFPDSDKMWKMLTNEKLLFPVKWQGEGRACVMHAVVREFIFHSFHEADAGRLASFAQTGFTSGTNMVDPGKRGAEVIEELFCELRRQCREAYKYWQQGKEISERDVKRAQSLCQEAFGVLRSRMLANTVARWGSYPKYIHYLVRMGDLARAYCGKRQDVTVPEESCANKSSGSGPRVFFWQHCDPALCTDSRDIVIHPHGPLFGDELAWLYHELGLALYHEGAMIDCLAIWEQGMEVNKFLDGNQPAQYTFQAYCNLGAGCIQYGRLPRAREYLQMAKDLSIRMGNKDKDHAPRLNGYLALVHHLRGDLLLADQEYEAAIKNLVETNNSRAECIFRCHWANLKIRLEDKHSAENFIRSSRAKAEEGHFPDLIAHARLCEGHLLRSREKYQDAIREYKIALKAAKQYGMRALEADVHCEMARLALDLGDMEIARTRAIKSLEIANELHLGLRQTHGLVVLGKATAGAGQRVLGVEYLKQARELAERQHYDLRAREAEAELHRLNAID